MATKLYVNLQAESLGKALVRSNVDLTPVDFSEVVVGDDRAIELYFVDGANGYASWSGNGSYVPILALGDCGYPTGGTFTLTFGANTTPAQPYNVSPATLQAALEALASVGAGNVTVSGSAGEYYLVEFIGSKAATNVAEISGNASLLTPAATVDVSTLVEGSGSANEKQLISLGLNPLVYLDSWSTITNGWSGRVSINTLELIQRFAADNVEGLLATSFQITVSDPMAERSTYVRMDASIRCSLINPSSTAGSAKPTLATLADLAAAVLAANGFTWENLTSAAAGNTDITRLTSSRHHTARVNVTGTGGATTRTLSVKTTNSPVAGDTVRLIISPDAEAGNTIEVRNSSAGGTLLETIVTDTSARKYSVVLTYTGSAWVIAFSDALLLPRNGNLAGLPSVATARSNLRTLLSRFSALKTASWSVTSADDGMFFPADCSAGDVVATIPAPGSVPAGFSIVLQKTDSSSNVLSTSPTTIELNKATQTVALVSDGTSWVQAMSYDPAAADPAVANYSTLTALTGGGATALDGVATADGAVATGQIAAITRVINGSVTTRFWQLVDGTDAESTHVIRPDDYNAATNPRVWKSAGGRNRRTTFTNNSGNTTVSVVPPHALAVANITGAASTRILVLPVPDMFDGDRLTLRVNLPAVASIIVQIRDATTTGTLLYEVTSEATAQSYVFELYFDGTAWAVLSNLGPVI